MIKCKDCIYFEAHTDWKDPKYAENHGWCSNKKVIGAKDSLLEMVWCDEFIFSSNFGCILGKSK